MSDFLDQLPPSHVEAEEAVLGACIMDPDAAPLAVGMLCPADFFREAHRTVFQAVVELVRRGDPVDFVSLGERLKVAGRSDEVGAVKLLSHLLGMVPTSAHLETYARLVLDAAVRRRLIQASARIAQAAYDQDRPLEEVSATIWQEIARARQAVEVAAVRSPTDRADDLVRVVAAIEERRGTGLSSGLADLDRVLHGLRPGQLVVVAARPSVGKSALLQGICRHVAARHGPTLLCSTEMSDDELVARDAAAMMRRNWREVERELASGRCSPETVVGLQRARERLAELPLHVYFNPRMTTGDVRAKSQEMRARHGLSLVAVDYLQLLKDTDGSRDSENVRVARVTGNLKALAGELRIPVLVASQLNRQAEARKPPIPELSDLRDCLPGGALVLNADTGERVPVGRIVSEAARFRVWFLDDHFRLCAAPITDAWYVNDQQIFGVTTRMGRRLRCTAGHKVRGPGGWTEVRNLRVGDAIAVPRVYPFPQKEETVTREQSTLHDSLLCDLAVSDVLWDEVAAISTKGVEPVYDISVKGNASFCVDDVIVHNSGSIEQDADVVIGLYRADRYYRPGADDREGGQVVKGRARLEVLKQRGGQAPVVLELVWVESLCEYRSLAADGDGGRR